MFQSDWAEDWLSRDHGFESIAYEVASPCYNPIAFRELCDSCDIVEIVTAWKTMKANSDYAWNDYPD